MRVEIRLEPFDERTALDAFARERGSSAGALASFVGYCRSQAAEDGAPVESLHLDHYPGFTEPEIARLAETVSRRYQLIDLLVIHRTGRVAPREPIVLVAAISVHRAAALAAVAELMDLLKTDAPFWKREVSDGQSRWIEPTIDDHVRRAARGD